MPGKTRSNQIKPDSKPDPTGPGPDPNRTQPDPDICSLQNGRISLTCPLCTVKPFKKRVRRVLCRVPPKTPATQGGAGSKFLGDAAPSNGGGSLDQPIKRPRREQGPTPRAQKSRQRRATDDRVGHNHRSKSQDRFSSSPILVSIWALTFVAFVALGAVALRPAWFRGCGQRAS